MARAGVNIIVLGGGPVVYSGGREQAERTIKELQSDLGIPVTNSSTAYYDTDKALGAKVVGTIAYASAPGATDHLPNRGPGSPDRAKIAGRKFGGIPFIDVGRVPSEVPLQMARELKKEHPEIDTIHLGSPRWATGAIIETLEQELGINIVQGSRSILWWALRSLGINDRIEGYGKLLREY
jgi:maleate isomerase